MDKATTKRSFRLAAVLGAVLLVGLGLVRGWEWGPSQPAREPDVHGRVVSHGGPGFLIESQEGGRLWIKAPESRCIRARNGQATALKVGQKVTAWSGPQIRESYPAQADAVWVIVEIEPEEPKAQ